MRKEQEVQEERENYLLGQIIEGQSSYAPQAADILASRMERLDHYTLTYLIVHDLRHADAAAEALIVCLEKDLETIKIFGPNLLDPIFDKISSLEIRKKAAEFILKMPIKVGVKRYIKVAKGVPAYKTEALEKLLKFDPHELNELEYLWQEFPEPKTQDVIWRKYLRHLTNHGGHLLYPEWLENAIMSSNKEIGTLALALWRKTLREEQEHSENYLFSLAARRVYPLSQYAREEITWFRGQHHYCNDLEDVISSDPAHEEYWKMMDELTPEERNRTIQKLARMYYVSTDKKIRRKLIQYFPADNITSEMFVILMKDPEYRESTAQRYLAGSLTIIP